MNLLERCVQAAKKLYAGADQYAKDYYNREPGLMWGKK